MVVSAILRGPGSLGLFSSISAGRKRRIMKAHKARVKRRKKYGVGIGFGVNLHLAQPSRCNLNITVSSAIVKRFCPRVLLLPGNLG